MDLARFAAVAGELLDGLGDRLSRQTRESVRTYLSAGEDGLAVDELAGTLCVRQTPVSSAERDLLRELLDVFPVDEIDAKSYPWLHDHDRVLATLNVVGAPPDPASHSAG
jgi:hypothetical protein